MLTTEKITITLPSDLMAAVRAMAPARRQSQLIAEAIRTYIAEQQRQALRDRLMVGYQANADADIALAAEWEAVEDEAWQDQASLVRDE